MDELKTIAFNCRLTVLDMVKTAKAGHIGGSMSCMDILVALYHSLMNKNDRFILSKGHCAEALYAVLAGKGFISPEELKTFASFNTKLAEHPTKNINGVDFATGALGHGLSLGVGLGLGFKADKSNAKAYVLMGDGELAEGSIWEAAMSAAKYKLDNLITIIDRNNLQISGNTEDVMPLENLSEKFLSFGWEVRTCNGHEPIEIINQIKTPHTKPLALIATTIKGYGSKLMENKADWHHNIPNDDEYKTIKTELIQRRDNP